ncbi:MAG: Gfo/Idh/MocA family oxidoreductase [Roseiflexaceae bacterium]
MSNTPITFVLVGAGSRGAHAYAPYAQQFPHDARIVAVAEPDLQRRNAIAELNDIGAAQCFTSYDALFAQGKIADAAIITTQDAMHVEPTLAALTLGYHVLLEKPMATSPLDCTRLVMAAEAAGKHLVIGHVLRYTDFFSTLHDVLKAGTIGEIITVAHRENVAHWHMGHSFVRGNWRRKDESTPMILAKCCHDLDIMVWNIGRECTSLSSVGDRSFYRREHAPAGSTARCLDGCAVESTCPWSAKRIYLDLEPWPSIQHLATETAPDQWPFNVVSHDRSYAARLDAVTNGPYGRCVFACDNDVVDHQVVSMEFAGGISATLTMHGVSSEENRYMRYDGTKGTLEGFFDANGGRIEIRPHRGTPEIIEVDGRAGHGGGDTGIMRGFVAAVRGEAAPRSSARESLESHLLAFASEDARLAHHVIDMHEYRNALRTQVTGG